MATTLTTYLLRLTEADRALIDAAAKDAGIPLSKWIRRVLIARAKRDRKASEAA